MVVHLNRFYIPMSSQNFKISCFSCLFNIAKNLLNLPPAIVRSIIGELRVYFSPSSSSSSSDRVEELEEDTTR